MLGRSRPGLLPRRIPHVRRGGVERRLASRVNCGESAVGTGAHRQSTGLGKQPQTGQTRVGRRPGVLDHQQLGEARHLSPEDQVDPSEHLPVGGGVTGQFRRRQPTRPPQRELTPAVPHSYQGIIAASGEAQIQRGRGRRHRAVGPNAQVGIDRHPVRAPANPNRDHELGLGVGAVRIGEDLGAFGARRGGLDRLSAGPRRDPRRKLTEEFRRGCVGRPGHGRHGQQAAQQRGSDQHHSAAPQHRHR